MATIAVHIPDSLKNLFLREHPARRGRKISKRPIFKAGKGNVLPVPEYPALVQLDFKTGKGEDRACDWLHSFKTDFI